MENPIVFLDIDGVLHSFNYEKFLKRNNRDWYDKNGALFDPICIDALQYLIESTNAKLVIHSSWKDSKACKNPLFLIKDIWKARHLPSEILDVTPTLSPDQLFNLYGINATTQWKGYEIAYWLKQNPQYKSYVIIDDQNTVCKNQKDFFVKVNGNKGLQIKDVKKAISKLKKQISPSNKPKSER